MKTGLIWIATSVVYASTAQAGICQDPTFLLPLGSPVVEDGEQVGVSFDIPDLKLVLSYLHCGEYHYKRNVLLTQALDLTTSKATILEATVALLKASQDSLLAENRRIHEMWKLENKKRHQAENKSDLSWVGWTVAAGLAITTLSASIAFYVK